MIFYGKGEMSNKYTDTMLVCGSTTPWTVSKITFVIFEEGVTNVGQYSFYCASSMRNMKIGNTVLIMNQYLCYQCEIFENNISSKNCYKNRY